MSESIRFKVMLLCEDHSEPARRPPSIHTDEAPALVAARALALAHKGRHCKAVVIKETRHGDRSEYEHVATFLYQRLLAEHVVWKGGE